MINIHVSVIVIVLNVCFSHINLYNFEVRKYWHFFVMKKSIKIPTGKRIAENVKLNKLNYSKHLLMTDWCFIKIPNCAYQAVRVPKLIMLNVHFLTLVAFVIYLTSILQPGNLWLTRGGNVIKALKTVFVSAFITELRIQNRTPWIPLKQNFCIK